MTTSIKEALEQCRNYIASNLRMSSEAEEQIRRDRLIERANDALATFQPDGERREAIARLLYRRFVIHPHADFDDLSDRLKTEWLEHADAILASGLVQDEASIRADEREKCAKIALSNRRQEEWCRHADVKRVAPTRLIQLVIYDAIRSARDGGAET